MFLYNYINMKLIIVRHGEAELGPIDTERQLTPDGQNDIKLMSRFIKSCHWKIASIFHSPLLRTTQTAQIIKENLDGDISVVSRSALRSGCDPEDSLSLLDEMNGNEAAIWVFHAPDVARVASILTGLAESNFYFPPGAMTALNLPATHPRGRSLLIWKLQPEFIRDYTPCND